MIDFAGGEGFVQDQEGELRRLRFEQLGGVREKGEGVGWAGDLGWVVGAPTSGRLQRALKRADESAEGGQGALEGEEIGSEGWGRHSCDSEEEAKAQKSIGRKCDIFLR